MSMIVGKASLFLVLKWVSTELSYHLDLLSEQGRYC